MFIILTNTITTINIYILNYIKKISFIIFYKDFLLKNIKIKNYIYIFLVAMFN